MPEQEDELAKIAVMAEARGLTLEDVYRFLSMSHDATRIQLSRDLRKARFDVKQANKERGKQGETIYQLRNEIAGLRSRLRTLQWIAAEVADTEVEARLARNPETLKRLIEVEAAQTNGVEPSKIEGLV